MMLDDDGREWVNCAECKHPRYLDVEPACPNPACYVGLAADIAASEKWYRLREVYVTACQLRASEGRYSINPAAFREAFERDNPRPVSARSR